LFTLEWTHPAKRENALLTDESVNKVQLQRSRIKLVRPLSTVENTRYARVFHSRQWSNYNVTDRVAGVDVDLAGSKKFDDFFHVAGPCRPQ